MELTLLREHVAVRKLIWVGPLTIVAAVIVNLIIRTIAVSIRGVPATFQYLQESYVIGGTIIFLLLALLAFVLVNRFAQRPIQFYRILALVVLCSRFSVLLSSERCVSCSWHDPLHFLDDDRDAYRFRHHRRWPVHDADTRASITMRRGNLHLFSCPALRYSRAGQVVRS